MNQPPMNIVKQNISYQMGLLHFAHLLTVNDNTANPHAPQAMRQLMEEENIPELVFKYFQDKVIHKTETQIYEEGVHLLNACTAQEKFCAVGHLHRLSKADNRPHGKKAQLLLYALNVDIKNTGDHAMGQDREITAQK
jgi:hypothetical protein